MGVQNVPVDKHIDKVMAMEIILVGVQNVPAGIHIDQQV